MINNKIYIDAVKSQYPDVSETCRPVIAFLKGTDSNDVGVRGFVIGDKYVINSDTMKIYDKADFYIINYMDEFDDE